MSLNRTGRALNKNEKILIGVLAVVALGYLTFTFIIEPSNKKLKPIEERIATLKAQVESVDSLQTSISSKQKELDGLKEKYEKASETIPKTDRYPQVVKDIERMAGESGVTITNSKYNKPKVFENDKNKQGEGTQATLTNGLTYLSVGLSLDGDYNKIMNFVKALESDTRILEVTNIDITKDKESMGGNIKIIYYVAGGVDVAEEYEFNTEAYGKDNLFE